MTVENFDPNGTNHRFSLSRRELIKSVIASGVAVSAGSMLVGCGPGSGVQTGGVERLISINVNGKDRRVDVLPQETLANTLRLKLGLTGTKLGCDRGECGACTILVDEVPVYACSTLTHNVRGRKITTVEGLQAPDGSLHPVQQAFVDELGPQCGFCTPGFLILTKWMLENYNELSEDIVKDVLSSNICRCTGYQNIIKSVKQVAIEQNKWVE